MLLAATLSICTSCCLFCLPWLAACKPCPADAAEACPSIGRSGNFKKYQCAPGHYNDLASLFFNTNDDTIRNLYSAGTDNVFQPSSIIIFFVASYFLGSVNFTFLSIFFVQEYIYLSMLPFLYSMSNLGKKKSTTCRRCETKKTPKFLYMLFLM